MRGTFINSLSRLVVLSGITLFSAGAGAVGFQPSETIFPATTRAWLSVPDPKGLRERFDSSPYGQLIADPAMKVFVDSFKEQISKNGKQRL